MRKQLLDLDDSYSRISERFYLGLSGNDRLSDHYDTIGFTPRIDVLPMVQEHRVALVSIEQSLQRLLPSLFPTPEIMHQRDEIRRRLEAIILSMGFLPRGTR